MSDHVTAEQAFEAIMAEAMTTVSAHGGKHGVYLNNLAAIVRPACAQAPRLLEALEGALEQMEQDLVGYDAEFGQGRGLEQMIAEDANSQAVARILEARAAIAAATEGDSHE